MELIIEFIVELILEVFIDGGEIILKSNKTSKWLRYTVTAIFFVISIAIIGFFGYLGIIFIDYSIFGGTIILSIVLLFTILFIRKLIRIYKEVKRQKENLLNNYNDQKGISPDL